MPEALEAKSVKAQLILALKNLSGLKHDKTFMQLLNRLESPEIIIPENKSTLDLLKFTYLLICQYPQILSDPNSQLLTKLCKDVTQKILAETPSEDISLKPSSGKKG